jgi:hypothetical protein
MPAHASPCHSQSTPKPARAPSPHAMTAVAPSDGHHRRVWRPCCVSLDPRPFRQATSIATASRVQMGAPPSRLEMRPCRNRTSPVPWNELSLRHAIEMQPSFPCTHPSLHPRWTAAHCLGETAGDGYLQVPRAPHRDMSTLVTCRLSLCCTYSPSSSSLALSTVHGPRGAGAVGHQDPPPHLAWHSIASDRKG